MDIIEALGVVPNRASIVGLDSENRSRATIDGQGDTIAIQQDLDIRILLHCEFKLFSDVSRSVLNQRRMGADT